jgi:hypothetical protein
MKGYNFLSILVPLLLSQPLFAQHHLPPTWSEENVQYESRTTAYLSPKRIVWKNVPAGASVSGIDHLLKPGIGQATLTGDNICHIKNGKKGTVSFLLDFGHELQGGIQFVTGQSDSRDIKVRICFGESASEAMGTIDGKNGASNDHAMRDFVFPLPWLGVSEYGNTGFRFVRIDVLGENTDLLLKEVRASFKYAEIPYRGSFECDNERLNKIWMTGAYTVHLNMQHYIWDGIKRDRLVWIGDIYPEVETVNTVFGYNDIVPRSLDLSRNLYPMPQWMNGYSSYSIWWLLSQYQWYMKNGDLKYLQEQRSYIISLLNLLIEKIGKNGKENLDGGRFLDWPSSENEKGINAGLQALMVMAMQTGEKLCTYLDDQPMVMKCHHAAAKLSKYVPDCAGCKQAAALMALAGTMNAKKANDKVLTVGGAKGFSTFYGYYMLQAMAKAGNYKGAMDIISQYWGGMLDLGATTFWEDFDIDWMKNAGRIDELIPDGKVDVHKTYGDYCYKGYRHSFCHGWASGPTSWLSENVLGVKVLEPGCRKVLIEPHLGNLKWVKGTYPTPYGVIKIEHRMGADGKIISNISAPDEVQIVRN